jgi:hypothetical protein
MRKGRIENWQELELFGRTVVTGNIYGCEKFEDGEEMWTSGIVEYRNMIGQTVVETQSGSVYHLGEPAEKDRTLQEIFQDAVAKDNAS